jgi:hypothetical protein
MAVVLGLSLRTFDPKRPVCLLHDDQVTLPPYVSRIFDKTISLVPDERYLGCMNKIRLYEYSPFNQTMFVDADCVLMKTQVDSYWSHCAGLGFTLPGSCRSSGYWEEIDLESTCKQFGCPYIVVMNSGTLYFEKGSCRGTSVQRGEPALFRPPSRAPSFPSQPGRAIRRRAVLWCGHGKTGTRADWNRRACGVLDGDHLASASLRVRHRCRHLPHGEAIRVLVAVAGPVCQGLGQPFTRLRSFHRPQAPGLVPAAREATQSTARGSARLHSRFGAISTPMSATGRTTKDCSQCLACGALPGSTPSSPPSAEGTGNNARSFSRAAPRRKEFIALPRQDP